MSSTKNPLDVLIAEDDGDVRLAVRQLLEGQGYTCAEAEDGRVAVEVARQQLPRLILMDLMMPEVDGFAAARQLRSDPLTQAVRIHCLTALNHAEARQAAQDAGCEGFLAKPFTPDELLGAVSAAVYALRPGDEALVQAVERLRQTLAARTPGREHSWCKLLASALADLESLLRQQMDRLANEVEFPQVDLCCPTLERRASELRQQRHRLLKEIRALRAMVDSAAQAFQPASAGEGAMASRREPVTAGPVVDFSVIRRAGERLGTAFSRHVKAERRVLFESVLTDVGVGD